MRTTAIPLALLTCVLTGAQALAQAVSARGWRLERGWLTTPGISVAGTGAALELSVADLGDVAASAGTPDLESLEDGGMQAVYRDRDLVVQDRFQPFAELGPRAWKRSVLVTNTGTDPRDIVRAELRVCPEPGDPGLESWTPRTFHMQELPSGQALCTAYHERIESADFLAYPDQIRLRVNVAWRVQPGETVEFGFQGIWLGHAGHDGFRAEAERWYRTTGFAEPVRYPDWIRGAVLYEASAAGHIDSRFSDVGGFHAFAKQVPYLADLGVSVLWLNAAQKHKTPPNPVEGGWNHYDPRDFLEIDPILGGERGFAALAHELRDHGIHLLNEVVPHGGHSVQAEALKAWWTRERDGELRRNWGGFGMDNASPEWQKVLEDSVAMLSGVGGIEGARIDVADGQGPNWGSPATGRASGSTIAAGADVIAALGRGIRRGDCPLPVLIPETAARPAYFAVPDVAVLGYGLETTHFVQELAPSVFTAPATLNRLLTEHFVRDQGSLPPGALNIQSLNNHDTVCEKGRAHYRFGVGLHQALYAVCIAVPGVPMMYQEEEVGAFFAMRTLNRVRRELPMLTDAPATFLPPEYAAPAVFAVLRNNADRAVLCLSNLSGETLEVRTQLPSPFADVSTELTDAVSGVTAEAVDGRFEWRLEPYAGAFLQIGSRDSVPPAEDPLVLPQGLSGGFRDGDVAVSSGGAVVAIRTSRSELGFRVTSPETDTERMVCEGPMGRFEVERVDQVGTLRFTATIEPGGQLPPINILDITEWGVSGRTGLLHDRHMRRNYPFPPGSDYKWSREHCWGRLQWGEFYRNVSPTGKLWQSAIEPLHPENPAIAVARGPDGGILISDIRTDACNVVLTDLTQSTEPGRSQLQLSFRAVDPDLDTNVVLFGRGQPWKLQGGAPTPARPLHVEFTLTRFGGGMTESLEAARLPFQFPGPVVTQSDGQTANMSGRHFFIDPGWVRWDDLAAVSGRFRIQLELRFTERDAESTELLDAYRLELNGERVPFEVVSKNVWSTGNAYFGHVLTPAIDLTTGPHTLELRTARPWCAYRPLFVLHPEE